MRALTKLKVLQPVVLALAVDVVDGLAGHERSAEMAGHDESVLQYGSVDRSH